MDEQANAENTFASAGGKASAAKLTAAERRARAKQAAAARWSAKLPVATHGSPDRPLRIAGIEIPCYVLADGRRVLAQRAMIGALGMSLGGSSHGRDRLAKFVGQDRLKPYVRPELASGTLIPIEFKTQDNRKILSYEATILADICDAVLAARKDKALTEKQEHIAVQCEILLRGFARVGIVALIDEVTGYQEARERDALAKILEAFIAKELRPYIRTFEPDYYKAICELKGWEFRTSSRRPRALAHITNDLIYSRLAPGVLDEMRRKNPIIKDGRRARKHFQWLTEIKGHPELQKHLARVTGWMQMAKEMRQTWDDFYSFLNKHKPVYRGPTLFDNLPFDDVEDLSPPSSTVLELPS